MMVFVAEKVQSASRSLRSTVDEDTFRHRAIGHPPGSADENFIATDVAVSLGFRPVRELTRMWLSDATAPTDPLKIFGLAEPGLG